VGGYVEPLAEQVAAARDQEDEDIKADRPQPGLVVEADQRLDDQRIGQQREEASDIARGIEEIRILCGRVIAARETGLQKRAVGGERGERPAEWTRRTGLAARTPRRPRAACPSRSRSKAAA